MKSFLVVSLLLAVVLEPELALGAENIIISKGYISQLCVDSCRRSAETALLEHCERGCRFFDYAQAAGEKTNETILYSLCTSSCEEAYAKGNNQNACLSGCGNAKAEIENVIQVGTHLLEESVKEMSFLNSLFDMMTSSLWSDEDDDTQEIFSPNNDMLKPSLASGSRIDYLDKQWPSKKNKLDSQNSKDEVEIFTMMANDMDSSESTLCATRMWLHRLSFILIVMGGMSLLFISFFYLLAFIKHKKSLSSPVTQESTASVDISSPPSYETLVKGGFIVLSKTDGTATLSDKDDKPFLA